MNPVLYSILSSIARRSSRAWCAVPEALRDAWAEEWMHRILGDRYVPPAARR